MRLIAALLLLTTPACAARAARPASTAAPGGCTAGSEVRAGAGIHDITGPTFDVPMMGYARLDQRTAGLHLRLWSRAFVVETPCNGRRVAFVSADLGQLFQSVKQGVVARLRRTHPGYDDSNVLLSATHTHSGPGGYSHYALYNLTILGFHRQNHEAIVEGITRSIERAHANLAPARLRVNAGELTGVSANRSLAAYELNPLAERALYPASVDTTMTLLRIDPPEGVPGPAVGTVNWFAVHNTSMSNENHLVSGDNKGYAAFLFEAQQGADYSPRSFVAAFAQSNEGDVTPNVTPPDGRGGDEVAATERSGRAQYEMARRLYDAAATPVGAPVDFRHAFVSFPGLATAQGTTCRAALGLSMLAGAEDGPGVGEEGVSCAVLERTKPLQALLMGCHDGQSGCHGEKPVAVPIGAMLPPWSPEVLPLQLLRIGQVAIVGVPFEMTTMAGRRLRQTVAARLAPAGVTTVVIAGLANAYAGYVATREEYAAQHYEGASTHFGPWTLAALQAQLDLLAQAMAAGTAVPPGPAPRDLSGQQIEVVTASRVDSLPDGARFGDVVTDARPSYAPGEVVSVRFWAADPARDLRLQGSYATVERRETDGGWTVVARDRDWQTKVRWEPVPLGGAGGRAMRATVEWQVPAGTSGPHRIRCAGTHLTAGGQPTPFEGASRVFDVR